MGEAAEVFDWWPVEEPINVSDDEDVAYLSTGEKDDAWLYGSD